MPVVTHGFAFLALREARLERRSHLPPHLEGASRMARSAVGNHAAQQRSKRLEPDEQLTRRGGMAHRYVLQLQDPQDVAIVLRVLSEVAIPLGYLLLLPSDPGDRLAAYLGVPSHDVVDLPIRFASRGIRVVRGEEVEKGAAPDA